MTSSQPGEMLTQDQFTHQISQMKQSITEELNLFHQAFRQEQAQILRDAMKEVLPEMEQRIIENISSKLDASKEITTPESDSESGKQSPGFSKQMSPRWTPTRPFYHATECSDTELEQTTGFFPIKPSVGKKLYTKMSPGGSWKTPDSSSSEGSHLVSY